MNWYKKANIWDDIKKYGPKSSSLFPRHETFPYDEGEYEQIVQYTQNKFNMDREQAEQYVQAMPEQIRRDYFIKNYGWSVPTEEAIIKLKGFIGNDTVLSVGSGNGLWSKLLQDIGVNAIATTKIEENNERDNMQMPDKNRYFTDVENLKHLEAIDKYPQAGVLLMSWPPYNDPMAYESLKQFKGNKIVYIGEGGGGCTGSDEFYNLLCDEWNDVEDLYIDIPQWPNMRDEVHLFTRG